MSSGYSTLASKLFFLAVQGSGALLSSNLEGALYKSLNDIGAGEATLSNHLQPTSTKPIQQTSCCMFSNKGKDQIWQDILSKTCQYLTKLECSALFRTVVQRKVVKSSLRRHCCQK